MQIKLRPVRGTDLGEIEITKQEFMIGRKEGCHLRLRHDLISRRHCVITTTDSQVFVRDLGSRNGTFLNGERVKEAAELHDGDQLRLAKLEFEVAISETASAQADGRDSQEENDGFVTAWLDEADGRENDTTCIELSKSDLEKLHGRTVDENTRATKQHNENQGDGQPTEEQIEESTLTQETGESEKAEESKSTQKRPLPWSRKAWH